MEPTCRPTLPSRLTSSLDLPRYFTPRPQAQAAPVASGLIEHLIDVFVLQGTVLGTQEVWVGVDAAGKLVTDVAQGLSSRAQAQLSYHEVSGGRTRSIDAQNVFLFDLQLVEQAPDGPGANDPVFLYGVLYGPLPPAGGGPVTAIEGQLTVTRADILEGLVAGAPFAFGYQGATEAPSLGVRPRCFHIALPAARHNEIAAGRGIVVAYPLLSVDLFASEPVNEIPVNQLSYDLLSGFWGDLCREEPRRYGDGKLLPLPDRATFCKKLQNEGYTVKNDVAVRRKGGLLGMFTDDEVQIPPEGNVDAYLRLASEALQTLTGWPSPRAVAMRTRMATSQTRSDRHPNDLRGLASPAHSAVPKDKLSKRPPPEPRARNAGPPAWMQDFVDAHRQPGRAAPHLTGMPPGKARLKSADKATPPARPDWMKDFES